MARAGCGASFRDDETLLLSSFIRIIARPDMDMPLVPQAA